MFLKLTAVNFATSCTHTNNRCTIMLSDCTRKLEKFHSRVRVVQSNSTAKRSWKCMNKFTCPRTKNSRWIVLTVKRSLRKRWMCKPTSDQFITWSVHIYAVTVERISAQKARLKSIKSFIPTVFHSNAVSGKSLGVKITRATALINCFLFPLCSPKKFKNLPRLKTHEDIHNNTQYICNICGISLNTKRTLKMHMVSGRCQRSL